MSRGLALALLVTASLVPATVRAQVAQNQAIVVDSCASVTLPLNDPHMPYMDKTGRSCTNPTRASPTYSVQRTTGIGTTGVQVSAADQVNRRSVANVATLACEIVASLGAAYGTGFPLPANGVMNFDDTGRTASAIFVACSGAGGAVAVLSY